VSVGPFGDGEPHDAEGGGGECLVVVQLGGLHGGAVRAGWAGRLMAVSPEGWI
jgi:hypothetical protein